MALPFADIASPSLTARAELTEGTLTLEFVGTADTAAIEDLSAYLKRVHAAHAPVGWAEVRCDFRKLSFMNSSCFKAFVVWIDSVKQSRTPYRIRFVTDQNMAWQRRSLEALRRLAVDIVTIERQ